MKPKSDYMPDCENLLKMFRIFFFQIFCRLKRLQIKFISRLGTSFSASLELFPAICSEFIQGVCLGDESNNLRKYLSQSRMDIKLAQICSKFSANNNYLILPTISATLSWQEQMPPRNPVTNPLQIFRQKNRFIIIYLEHKAMKIFVVALALLLISVMSTGYSGNLWISNLNYQHKPVENKWWVFLPSCYGGSGRYQYSWSRLPAGWSDIAYRNYNQYENYIFWPYNVRPARYQVGVRVYDITLKIQVKKFLVIDLEEPENPEVFTRDNFDDYYKTGIDYDFLESDIYVIPPWKLVENLIEDGDVEELRQIIERVIESDNDCDEKKAFLNGLLNRIEKYLATNRELIKDLKDEIVKLEVAIQLDEQKLEQLNDDRDYDGPSALNLELQNAMDFLDFYSKRIVQSQQQIRQYSEDIQDLKNQISTIRNVQIENMKNSIQRLQGQADELIKQIAAGEGDIPWLRFQLRSKQRDIKKMQIMLEEAEDRIAASEWKIDFLDQKILVLEAIIREDTNRVAEYETEIALINIRIDNERPLARIDTDIESVQAKIDDAKTSIIILQTQIKIAEASASGLRNQYPTWKILFAQSIFDCVRVPVEEEAETVDQETEVSEPEFENYIEITFGPASTSVIPSRSTFGVRNVYVNSPSWQGIFGYSYNYGVSLWDEPFSCGSLNSRPSNYGIVVRIEGAAIWATDDNDNEWELSFASCSSLQTATRYRHPRVGDKIIWAGSRNSISRKYKVRSAICV